MHIRTIYHGGVQTEHRMTAYLNLIFRDPCIVDNSVHIPRRCSIVIEFIIPKVY
jgi:hypothetical protein